MGHPNNHAKSRTNRFWAVLAPLAGHLASGGAVLTYHGLQDGQGRAAGTMHVRLERFVATLRALGAVATFVPLRELVDRHLAGRGTRGLVALTFDDAYATVAEVAWPVLQDLAIPVTVFVVSEAARTGAPFWWDRVEQVFAAAGAERWRQFENEVGLPREFRTGQPADMGPLRPFRQWLLAEHRGCWPEHFEEPLKRLETEFAADPIQRPLRFEELDRLVESPLVDVGVHTRSHPVLPLLAEDEIRREIREGYGALRERYARTLPVLAPPFGLYDHRTVSVAREEGVRACFSLEATSLQDQSPDGMIPRFCMSERHRPWKAVLYTLGWHRGGLGTPGDRYPDLPSATT